MRSTLTLAVRAPTKVEEPTQQTAPSPSHTPPAGANGMATFAPIHAAQSHVRSLARSVARAPSPTHPYWADMNTLLAQNHSADSLSDESSFRDDAGRSAESEHVTQVHRIAGRRCLQRSVEGILQRTLSRSRSKQCSTLSSSDLNTNVVIGVVVEEDHVEESEVPQAGRAKAYVQAPSAPRPQPSRTMTIPGAGKRDANGSWRSKAGELFKRKTWARRSTVWTMTTPTQQAYTCSGVPS